MNLYGIESRPTIESVPFMKTNDHDVICKDLLTYESED